MRRAFWLLLVAAIGLVGCRPGDSTETTRAPQRFAEEDRWQTPQPEAPNIPPPVGSTSGGGSVTAPASTQYAPEVGQPLTDQFIIKSIRAGVGDWPEFTVTVNGTAIGFNADAQTDITPFFVKGNNTVVVHWEPPKTGPRPNSPWDHTLTIGVKRNGRWNTVVKQSVPCSISTSGLKTYSVMAQ